MHQNMHSKCCSDSVDMSVEEVFLDVGREIGRGPNEMEPFIQKVELFASCATMRKLIARPAESGLVEFSSQLLQEWQQKRKW